MAETRTNPYEELARARKVPCFVEVMRTYGWDDLTLVRHMADPHWEVVTHFARMRFGRCFTVPSRQTRARILEELSRGYRPQCAAA